MHDVFISTTPFAEFDPAPLRLMEENGISYLLNPTGRKLGRGEVGAHLREARALIAGTEPIGLSDIEAAGRLRLISRVGVGLDNVDLAAARDHGVAVAYTPDAPSPAVAELALGLMIDLARGITRADRMARALRWERRAGRRLADLTVGIAGVGRIGFRVIRLLQPFQCRILAHDRTPSPHIGPDMGVEWTDWETLLRESDILSLHLPLGPDTRKKLGAAELARMKRDAAIVNTARGGLIDEAALLEALRTGVIRAAALDVFEEEPYSGPLREQDNVILTTHMGSFTEDCRARMEMEAAEETVRFLTGRALRNPVPMELYPRPAGVPGAKAAG